MDIKCFVESLGKKKEELKRLVQCKTPEELLAFAEAKGVPLDEKGAKELLEGMKRKSHQLSDEELVNVAGGYRYIYDELLYELRCYDCGRWDYIWYSSVPEECTQCHSRNIVIQII